MGKKSESGIRTWWTTRIIFAADPGTISETGKIWIRDKNPGSATQIQDSNDCPKCGSEYSF